MGSVMHDNEQNSEQNSEQDSEPDNKQNARPARPARPARRLNPAKLRLSKWTAVVPRDREKHFIVVELVAPALPGAPLERLVLEAVHSGRRQALKWKDLLDERCWHQGWA